MSDQGVSGRIEVAIGLGCQRGVALATLELAVDAALRPLGEVNVYCLATHAGKSGEPALIALARDRGWPLRLFPAEALTAVRVPNPSARAAGTLGTPSVAEAAALLAAGSSQLLATKRAYRGPDGKAATVAVAPVETRGRSEQPGPPAR